MPSKAEVIRSAQRGKPVSHFFPIGKGARQPAIPDLDADQRRQVVDVFSGLLEGLYAHLPLKRSMYGIDSVQRLRLLRQRVGGLTTLEFHYEMARIITGLRDAHTRYVGPSALEGHAAVLPFVVEAVGPASPPQYIVANVATDKSLIGNDEFFKPGVEIRWWNAVPMDRAVDRHADDEIGGRPDARRARALESMTLRALRYGPPPDERWVTVGYLDEHGRKRDLRLDWRVVTPQQAATAMSGQPSAGKDARALAIDPAAETHRRAKKLLFAPELWYADQRASGPPPALAEVTVPVGKWIPTSMQDAVSAKVVRVGGRRLGYLRLWSFDVADDEAYVREVMRLLGRLPDAGLIIDLRSNPGGLIWAAERLLQLFTPNQIVPTKFSLLATALTRALANAPQNDQEFEPWRQSLEDAVADGEPYSRAVPLTPVEACNNIGQVYGGPVVAIVDAKTYSAGDLFAAGFVDNGIGRLISVGDATGGGGANVWQPEHVQDALLGTDFQQDALPAGISYTLAARRATRAGSADGAAIEDVGVRGERHPMTKRDVTGRNENLVSFAGRHVLGLPRTTLTVTFPVADGESMTVRTVGIDQLDVVVDGVSQPSRPVAGKPIDVVLPLGWTSVEVRGTAAGRMVQRRVLQRAT
jgi:Peptidase family S41